MKRLIILLLAFIIILSFCACEGNWKSVNLKDSVAIPEDGQISKNLIQQLQNETGIGIFTGKSGAFQYEWTIFGCDIAKPKEVNLGVEISKPQDDHIQLVLQQTKAFGFSALLSIYLNEQWNAQSATAYANDKAVASVSVTGSKTTILNLTLDGSVSQLLIYADEPAEGEITTNPTEEVTSPTAAQDDYLSKPQNGDNTTYTGGKDKYLTDPVPEGKPKPVEPEDTEVNKDKRYTCTFSIECSTILNNLDMLDPAKLSIVPSGGVILKKTTVTFYEGESVFDVLQRLCKEKGIHMEAEWTPIYNSAYVEGIHNLYEFDCGALSGWMYKVNGWYPNYGSSRYQLKDGDVVEWRYTCDLGNDVGGAYAVGG